MEIRRKSLFGPFVSALLLFLQAVTLQVQAQEPAPVIFVADTAGHFADAFKLADYVGTSSTVLKVSGPLSGADIDSIKSVVQSQFIHLDLSDAQITDKGSYSYLHNTYPMEANSIGRQMFYRLSSLESIKLPSSVVTIGYSAFYECLSLKSITLPPALITIGNAAFCDTSLADIEIPSTLKNIGYYAFSECDSLTSITLPSEMELIDDYAFEDCAFLESITMPSTLTTMGYAVFSGCEALTSITLPSSLTSLEQNTFSGCTSLTSITWPSQLTTLGNSAFYGCTSLESITLPSSLTSIGNSAFENCTSMASIALPSSLASIENYAFENCTSLASIDLPSQLTTLGSSAFRNCTSLTSIALPSQLNTLSSSVFYGCTSLASITLPSQLNALGSYAFYGCTSLASITLPSSLASIESYAFQNCTSLASITLPSQLKTLGNNAFYGCSSLASIAMPSSLTSIGTNAFNGCTSLASIDLPSSLTSIGSNAFYNCTSLASVTLPNSLTSIGSDAFRACTSLTSIALPSSLTSISNNTFASCTSLSSVTLPEGLQTIASNAFCETALAHVTLPSTITTISSQAFANCLRMRSFTVNEGCTTINGSTSPWYGCKNIKVLYLPSTLTKLHTSTFQNMTNLQEVHLGTATPLAPSSGTADFGVSGVTLYVPAGTSQAYKEHASWDGNWAGIFEDPATLAGISDTEWNILKQIPNLTGGSSWTSKWTLGETPAQTPLPKGVALQDGKVASLFLQHNNLTGSLPYIIFALPYLRTADLSGNQLTGSIKRNEADHAAIYEGLTLKADSLQYLDISVNQLTGNLSDIMPYAPALTTLKANENRISEITPIINVATLEFDAQDLRGIFTVKYSDLCKMREGTENTLPTVLTYSNSSSYADSYKTTVSTYISDTCGVNLKDRWYMQLNTNLLNGIPTPTYYNTVSDGWYNNPSGITQNAFSSASEWSKRHRFHVVMDYEMGDANFDAQINLSDMQKTLNTALDSTYYGRYMPFNFYAANLISTDKTINVQDVVASINLLLDLGVTPTLAKARAPQQARGTEDEEEEPEATLSIIDGKLVLSTARPVAALDLVSSDESVEWEPVMNLFSKSARATRTIFYSLFGDLLPEGETVLAELQGTITAAMLVDIDGNEIPLRIIDGEATGIDAAPDAAQQGSEAYDLQGRRVSTQQILQKGIYIIDGKKVMQ